MAGPCFALVYQSFGPTITFVDAKLTGFRHVDV